MKNKKKFLIIIFLISITILSFSFYKKSKSIDVILESESYSYLNKEAKNYVKQIYEETGEVVLTEKNKKANEPYLNPRYIEYLQLSDEEKENVDEIPIIYTIDYVETEVRDATLPTSFDLRSYNNKNYVTPLKNQRTLDLCWDFSALEQAESYVMLKNNQPYNTSTIKFSERQLDYASSTDGIESYENENGSRALAHGGNSLSAYVILVNGLGMVDENLIPYDLYTTKRELQEILNYDNSLYEVNEALILPTIDESTSTTTMTNFVKQVKQLVMDNGGVYVGTQGPGYSCSSINSDGNAIIRVDDACTQNAGHAMHIIGWNDNYSYSYCKKSNNIHSNDTSNCSSSNLVTGRGAWILRNSWGSSNYPYVYLAYDSYDVDVSVITDMTSMSNKTWDNNYHGFLDPFYFYLGLTDTLEVEKKINIPEKIEKVKFFTFSSDATFTISISANGTNYNRIASLTAEYPGFYTFDLSDKNIVVNGSDFDVTITTTNNTRIVKNSISVFTSNTTQEKAIKSTIDSLTLDKLTSNYRMRLYSDTKNIPSNGNITYTLVNRNNENYTSYISYLYNKVAKNDVNTQLIIASSIPEGRYTLKLNYQGVLEEIPIMIGNATQITVYYKYNVTGNNSQRTQKVEENTQFNLLSNTFTRTGYTFASWNTNSGGSGTTYNDSQTIENGLDNDLTLYAQWTPINYKIRFNPNGGAEDAYNQPAVYDTSLTLRENRFTRERYTFKSWNTKADGTGTTYLDGAQVINLTTENNAIVNLYAQWEEIRPYRINHYNVDYTNMYIDSIEIDTTKATLESYIEVDEGYSYVVEFGDSNVAFTGSKTKIYHGDELIAEFTNIVRGDVNGDGIINSADLLKIVKHLKETSILTGAPKIAADCNKSNDINSADLLKIVKYLKGTGTL